MSRLRQGGALGTLMAWFAVILVAAPDSDPFEFLRPTVAVTAGDRQRLDRGQSVARVIPSGGSEVAVFAAVPIGADADRVVAWMRRIEELKKSPYVTQIGRFSDPPTLQDLDSLSLSDGDVEDARWCRPGRCGLKLAAPEMEELRHAVEGARGNWRAAVQQTFRRIVLARVQAYGTGGYAALAPYADHERRPPLAEAFSSIVQHSRFLTERHPALSAFLAQCPCHAPTPTAFESFLYWSKEQLSGKPVVVVTHVVMVRGEPGDGFEVLVAGKQVFATHYMSGSLGMTVLLRGEGNRRYLTYVNRTNVDLLGGFWSPLVRRVAERRLASEAPDILQGLKRRIDSGDPPATPVR